MSRILFDTLIEGIDAKLAKEVKNDEQLSNLGEKYLSELLLNDELLSTESYTTTSSIGSGHDERKKTVTEEIAELDEKFRGVSVQISALANENRDKILDQASDISEIRQALESSYMAHAEEMIDTLQSDSKEKQIKSVSVSESIDGSMQTNSFVLSNIDAVLDLLEIPTLCKLCVLQGNYQEALELSMLAQTMTIKFPQLSVFRKIQQQIHKELKLMVKGLIKLLSTNLRQNQILKIFQILNKLDLMNYSDTSDVTSADVNFHKSRFLKIIYLNARFSFIVKEIQNLRPLIGFNKMTYLKRFIEIYRELIFNSLSIYYTIFTLPTSKDKEENENATLLNEFVQSLGTLLTKEIRKYLPTTQLKGEELDEIELKSQQDGLILQIFYLCKSLSRYNADFESLITLELCFNEPIIISEKDWNENLEKVKKIRT